MTNDKIPSSMTSAMTIEVARKNSRLAAVVSVVSALLTILTLAVTIYIDTNYGKVAAVPVGNMWDLPIVRKIYAPSRIEENSKPIQVAMRYIRNFYEVDLTDFVQLGADTSGTGGPVMVSTRATQLLPYVLPGTSEYENALKTIEYSSVNYRLFNESKCWRRFLVDSVEMQDSVSGTKRIDAVGKFIIACDDTTKPIPSENIGSKIITIFLTKGLPTMLKASPSETDLKNQDDVAPLKNESLTTAEITALNPEGWFVVKNTVTPISEDSLKTLTKMREKQGVKAIK